MVHELVSYLSLFLGLQMLRDFNILLKQLILKKEKKKLNIDVSIAESIVQYVIV